MIKIGLTGSIGMGKTETAKMFMDAGIPVFDSDASVHILLGENGPAVDQVEAAFPGTKSGNKIDREMLAKEVFGNEAALKRLENILHPMVSNMRTEFVHSSKSDMVLFDIPLLFEKSYEDECDYIVVVTAPADVQRKRVMARPGMTEQRFQEILEKQMPDDLKREKADFIVQSDKGFDYAKTQVKKIIDQIRNETNA